MLSFSGKIHKNYGWEIAVFHKVREYSDGITFWETNINWDRYLADHCPRFEFHIILLNFTVVEFNVYYLHHRR